MIVIDPALTGKTKVVMALDIALNLFHPIYFL